MSFLMYIIVGFISGFIGGMGMGGGTVLIPALTIVFGVNQHVAQATNLISFLPMAAFSLNVHKKQGLLKTQGLLNIEIPALIASVSGGFSALFIAGDALKKLFGFFLIALAVKQVTVLKKSFKE